MQSTGTECVCIQRYADQIIYLQLKYGRCSDVTQECLRLLPEDMMEIERKSLTPGYHGQTVADYLMELEDSIQTWDDEYCQLFR